MTQNGYYPKRGYFSEFEINKLFLKEDGCYYRTKQFELFMIIGSYIIIRVLLLQIIFKISTHKNEEISPIIKRNIKILGSCIYYIFSHIVKEHLNENIFEMQPLYYKEFLANTNDFFINEESILIERSSTREIKTKNEIIIGGFNQIYLKDFVSSQNFKFLTNEMFGLLYIIKQSLEKFSSLMWNLSTFEKAKRKMREIEVLMDRFGDIIDKEEYERQLAKYQGYMSSSGSILQN